MTHPKTKPRKPRDFKMRGYEYISLEPDGLRIWQGLQFGKAELARFGKYINAAIAWQKGERR